MPKTLTACLRENVLATEAEILEGCETFYGVPLAHITDEFESKAIVAIGHPEPRRFLAALLAYARSHGLDPWDIGLRRVTADTIESAKKWHLLYRHADGVTVEDPDGHPSDWCVCDDANWWAAEAAESTPGAKPVIWWVL